MDIIILIAQWILALGILNVWLIRYRQDTEWRGGDATTMKEEFKEYGLPQWMTGVVGILKIACATLLIAGTWVPSLTRPAAIILAVLMVGAIVMHIRINDPVKKSLPATTMLALSVVVASLA